MRKASLPWRESVRELLTVTEHSEAELARTINANASTLFRWLHGQRVPSPDDIRKVNSGLSELLSEPRAGAYLNIAAAVDGLIEIDDEQFVEDRDWLISIVSETMKPGFAKRLMKDVKRLSKTEQKRFWLALVLDWRRRYISPLTGEIITETWLDAFLQVSDSLNLPGREWLKDHQQIQLVKGVYAFGIEVSQSLVDLSVSPRDRLRCEQRILKAHEDEVFKIARQHKRQLINLQFEVEELMKSNARLSFELFVLKREHAKSTS